jgi:hypothetical protein
MALSKQQLDQWLTLAARTPSADNSQPWRFHVQGNSLSVHFLERQPSSLFGCDAHATLLSIGGMAHALKACGATISWHDLALGQPYFTAHLPDAAPRDAKPFLERHTNRHPCKKGGISMDSLRAISINPDLVDARVDWIVDPNMINSLARSVGELSYIRFTNKAQHASLMKSLRFTQAEIAQGDGLDINTLHLPPGGRAFMKWITPWERAQALHKIGIARVMAMAEQKAFSTCGAICVISGKFDENSTLNSGAMMIEIWKELNLMRLAVQPWYVLSEGSAQYTFLANSDSKVAINPPNETYDWIRRLLQLPNGSKIHMALKVSISQTDVTRSRRLELSELVG